MRNYREYESPFAGYLTPTKDSKIQDLLAENDRLTKENIRLQTENSIMKKFILETYKVTL